MLKIAGFNGKFGVEQATSEKTVSPQRRAEKVQVTVNEQSRLSASFKIKDSLRQLSQAEPVYKTEVVVEKQEQIHERERITEEKVIRAFERYVHEHLPEPTVSIALKTHLPDVKEEEIIVAVDNQLQLDKMEGLKPHLHHFLMKTLKNGFIRLSFKLFDEKTAREEKKLFTAQEKFEHFIKMNPVIANLKNMFGLELE